MTLRPLNQCHCKSLLNLPPALAVQPRPPAPPARPVPPAPGLPPDSRKQLPNTASSQRSSHSENQPHYMSLRCLHSVPPVLPPLVLLPAQLDSLPVGSVAQRWHSLQSTSFQSPPHLLHRRCCKFLQNLPPAPVVQRQPPALPVQLVPPAVVPALQPTNQHRHTASFSSVC